MDAAHAAGLSLLIVARPGYGNSTPVELESVSQYVPTLISLFDELGLDRVGVLGVSAGALYSYALAALAPERVAAVAITSGLGLVNEAETRVHYPQEAQQAFEWFGHASADEVSAFWLNAFRSGIESLPHDDPWRVVVQDSLAYEGAGPGREAILQQRPWGFDVAEIAVPVMLWHSPEDPDVPFATAQIVADRIPTATLALQDEPDHIPSAATLNAALSALAAHFEAESA